MRISLISTLLSLSVLGCAAQESTISQPVLSSCGLQDESDVRDADACHCIGAIVNANPGPEADPHCPVGTSELGPIEFGIEGAFCCTLDDNPL